MVHSLIAAGRSLPAVLLLFQIRLFDEQLICHGCDQFICGDTAVHGCVDGFQGKIVGIIDILVVFAWFPYSLYIWQNLLGNCLQYILTGKVLVLSAVEICLLINRFIG